MEKGHNFVLEKYEKLVTLLYEPCDIDDNSELTHS